jgi:hypothetical protein
LFKYLFLVKNNLIITLCCNLAEDKFEKFDIEVRITKAWFFFFFVNLNFISFFCNFLNQLTSPPKITADLKKYSFPIVLLHFLVIDKLLFDLFDDCSENTLKSDQEKVLTSLLTSLENFINKIFQEIKLLNGSATTDFISSFSLLHSSSSSSPFKEFSSLEESVFNNLSLKTTLLSKNYLSDNSKSRLGYIVIGLCSLTKEQLSDDYKDSISIFFKSIGESKNGKIDENKNKIGNRIIILKKLVKNSANKGKLPDVELFDFLKKVFVSGSDESMLDGISFYSSIEKVSPDHYLGMFSSFSQLAANNKKLWFKNSDSLIKIIIKAFDNDSDPKKTNFEKAFIESDLLKLFPVNFPSDFNPRSICELSCFESKILNHFFVYGEIRENFVSLIDRGFLNFIRFFIFNSTSETAFDRFFEFFVNGISLVVSEERKKEDIKTDLEIIEKQLNINTNCYYYFIYMYIILPIT